MDDRARKAAGDPGVEWTRHRRLVRLGQAFMVLGLLIAAVHLVMHLAENPSGWTDLTVGYPTAAVALVVGALLAGRAQPKAPRR